MRVPVHFAINNTDFPNDTADGKDEMHGTGQVVFQKFQHEHSIHLKVRI
jgi:hypothetical protein